MKKLLLNVVGAVVMMFALTGVAQVSPAYAESFCHNTSNGEYWTLKEGESCSYTPTNVRPTGANVKDITTSKGSGGNFRCADGSTTTDWLSCPENADAPSGKLDLTTIIKTIINVIVGLVGFIAVVMMIIGGISFITSQGDSNKVTKARNTILYGVVGLVIAMLAYAIVNFVLSNVFKSSSTSMIESSEIALK